MDDLNCIQIVVPAAGDSKRFKNKGIDKAKPLIKFSYDGGMVQTMLEHSVTGLQHNPVFIGCKTQDYTDFNYEFMSLERFTLISLDTTYGQADTVRQMVGHLRQDRPVLVVNCDAMFLYPLSAFMRQALDFEAAVMVFDGEDSEAYSYVDSFPLFQRGEEKKPISPWAIAGAFYFRSAGQLRSALKVQMGQDPNPMADEPYLSQTLQYIDGDKLAVHMPKGKLVGWGTPEQLLADPLVANIKF